MAEKITIAEIGIDTDALIKQMTHTRSEIDNLKKSQKELESQGQKNSKQYSENEIALKNLSSSYGSQKNTLSQLTDENNKLLTVQEALTSAINKEITSIDSARASNKELLAIRNQLNLSTAEGQEELARINAKLDENNAFIKENVSAYEQQKIGIGDYKTAIKEAFDELNIFNGGFTGFLQRSKEAGGVGNLVSGSLKGMAQGFLGMAKASLAFIATPIGAVLAVLVLAFALVKNAMNRSEEATNKITKIFTIFSGIVGKLLSALEPLGEFLIDGLVAGFEMVGKIADKTIGLLAKGLAFLGFDEASNSIKEFQGAMQTAVKEASALADAEAKLEKQQRLSQKVQLDYQKQAEKLRQIRDDETKSMDERIKANEDLGAVLKKQLDEELKIAQLSLVVANARIKAEGQTKDNLDKQAEALTLISDIQERITGQESEQLVNRNSLQKEANEKAKELREKRFENELQKMNEELELFKQQQGIKKKSLEEQLLFEQQVADKSLEILKKQFDAGKISKTAYESEKLAITNEYAQKQVDGAIETAQRELDIYKKGIEQKIADDTFFTQEKLNAKIQENADLAKKETDFQLLRKEKGQINEQEYLDAVNLIKENQRIKDEEAEKLREEAQKEKEAIDLENKRLAQFENYQIEYEQKLLQMEQDRIAEVENAEKTGADVNLINAKYKKQEAKLTADVESKKRQDYSNTFGSLGQLFGEASALGKAFSIAQATITGYEAVMNAYSTAQKSPISILNPAYPFIQAGIAGAFSVAQVAKIASAPKMAKGGIIGGNRHSSGGTKFYGEDGTTFEAEKGEYIGVLSRQATSKFLEFNNQFTNGVVGNSIRLKPKFQTGGIFSPSRNVAQISQNSANDTAELIAEKINMIKVVTVVEDITNMQGIQSEIIEGANV